jgi:hypothetical protein
VEWLPHRRLACLIHQGHASAGPVPRQYAPM